MKNSVKPFYFEDKHIVMLFDTKEEQHGCFKMALSSGHKPMVVTDVNEALESIGRKNFSLIIADISESQTNGYELCEKIKGNLSTCHIPFVFISAQNSVEQMIQGYELGADDYITKPFDEKLLMVRLNRLVQNRKRIREKYRKQSFVIEPREKDIPKDKKFISSVRKVLEDNLSDPDFNVASLSEKLNISTTQVYRILKNMTGHTPVEFIRNVRLQNAFDMLNQNKFSVTEVCYHSGFNNVSYFIKCFKYMFGVTPGHFRNKISNDIYDEVMCQNQI
ncbi:helix-turn-helix domain-containing protein [Mariniphaga sp.]|uniref:helix-turn-helix domain-containing protein n=1 Tax=Mariniphaga sp. TaxID=1954475 RepID=UPI00356330C0